MLHECPGPLDLGIRRKTTDSIRARATRILEETLRSLTRFDRNRGAERWIRYRQDSEGLE
jgi:hypothetical protein